MATVKTYFLNLNFFQSSKPEDKHDHRSNIIATRVYIIVFTISLFILILALWLTPQTTKMTLQYPTEDQFRTLPSNAYCPCSNISLSYGQFISIQAKFHQVCSSDFVTDRWIESIFHYSTVNYIYSADFRVIGSSQFRALASLCYLTQASVLQSITSFNMMLMITPNILSRSIVQTQAQSSFEQIQLTTVAAFEQQLDFIRIMIIGNQLFSALQTNILLRYAQGYQMSLQMAQYIVYNISNDSYCDCQINMDCRVPSGIFKEFEQSYVNAVSSTNRSLITKIDGFVAGCMPMDSILQSTLQCFYNQTCLNELLSFFPTNETFIAMNQSNHTHFTPMFTVKELVHELMVEEWIINISYENYYNQCAPITCTYSKMTPHDLVYVLIKVIGLLGGLTLTFTFIIPIIVRFIRRKKNTSPSPRISWCHRIRQLLIFLKKFLVELNIFEHFSSNNRQVYYQRIATRLYIFSFIISLTILCFCTLMTKEIYQKTIHQPTEIQFNNLQQIYPNSLSCPCSIISAPYKTFTEITPSYHQICSSDMISQRWIDYYNSYQRLLTISPLDFRNNGGGQFQLMAILCAQAKQTVNDSLQIFLGNELVSSHLISPAMFRSEINESIEEWKANTLNSFLRPIQLIRVTNQGNQLINALHNFYITFDQTSRELIPTPTNYSNCSCARSSTCRTSMGIFDYNWTISDFVELFRIPNFFIGCYPVESLLESTLECFYDHQCMKTIESSTHPNLTTNFSLLDSTRNSPNETIQSILNRLMIDSWLSNISFSDYYQMCAPSSCTYEYTDQHDIFYLISSILGIFAGLSLGMRILILVSLRFIEKIVDDLSWFGLKKRLRGLFICYNEQQITNRCQFILLVFILTMLFLISSLTLVTRTEQITIPSLSMYQNLLKNYPNSIQCPCSHISIEYQSFLNIVPYMHQVCSSEFVSDNWIDYVYSNIQPLQLNSTDFGRTAVGQYQLLASLCQLSQEVVDDGLANLATSSLINSQLLSSNLLNTRIRAIVKEFRMTIPKPFLDSLSFIRQTTAANMLMNMFMTNWKFDNHLNETLIVSRTSPLDYQGCSCGTSSKCVQSSEGMMSGCYPLEALLQSTFQCFYNQTCIDSTNTFQALSISSNRSSQYAINSTIESILNYLMVENYSMNISYENYFAQCQPLQCSYSYIGRREILGVTSTVIGLYGGLAIIARSIVVLLIKLSLYRKRKISPQIDEQ